jgi:hypothetical protein
VAVALFVLLAVLLVWLAQSGIFAPSDPPVAPVPDGP